MKYKIKNNLKKENEKLKSKKLRQKRIKATEKRIKEILLFMIAHIAFSCSVKDEFHVHLTNSGAVHYIW